MITERENEYGRTDTSHDTMWSPTHIQVTVQRAKGLLIKGKHGTNNCFVIIALGKEKYQTSVKEKAPDAVDWHEECELQIPTHGNRAELVLTALHHNSLGIDEFLGQVILPLNEMDVYERPRSRWFKLQSKPSAKEKKAAKERGELEVRIAFTVKAGSLTDLSKKESNKGSISKLASNVGGSLLSIGAIEKRKGLKKFAKSLGSKVHISGIGKKKNKADVEGGVGDGDGSSFTGSYSSIGTPSGLTSRLSRQTFGDADPGVISEDEDEFVFDNLSHKSSGSSLNINRNNVHGHGQAAVSQQQNQQFQPRSATQSTQSTPDETRKHKSMTLPAQVPSKPPRVGSESEAGAEVPRDEWEQKLYGKHLEIGSTDSLKRRSWESSRVMLAVQQEEEEEQGKLPQEPPLPAPTSVTAPTSPTLAEKSKPDGADKPRPLPRVGSQEVAASNKVADKLILDQTVHSGSRKSVNAAPSPKLEKEHSSSSFTKKLKHFIKDHRAESMENLSSSKTKLNGTKPHHHHHHHHERIIIGGENELLPTLSGVVRQSKLVTEVSPEIAVKYEGKTREDMMRIAHNLESEVHYQKQKVKELEDYLDSLLLKVMECQPRILQNPYQTKMGAGMASGHPTKSG